MNTYKTIDIARIIGIHVNTVRLYEKCGLIPKPERLENGYRVFTDLHIEQFKLARAALQVEVLQNGLRKQAVDIIKVSALRNYEKAMELTRRYIAQIDIEKANAEEAIRITQTNIRIAINTPKEDDDIIRACDKLLTSLNEAKNNAFYVTCQIEKMKKISE